MPATAATTPSATATAVAATAATAPSATAAITSVAAAAPAALRQDSCGAEQQNENDEAELFHGFLIAAGVLALACGDSLLICNNS